ALVGVNRDGRGKGRVWAAVGSALVTFLLVGIGGQSALEMRAPDYWARYRQEHAAAVAASRSADSAAGTASINEHGWYRCSLSCDVVSACQGLARNRRGQVMDAGGQSECDSARSACLDRCTERFPTH